MGVLFSLKNHTQISFYPAGLDPIPTAAFAYFLHSA
jgi:hypothetical protein